MKTIAIIGCGRNAWELHTPIITRHPEFEMIGTYDIIPEKAEKMGADALLLVTPYYNKATQAGLEKMFTILAENSKAPVILYNVPSRTGVNIEPATYKALADHENIIAIKAFGHVCKKPIWFNK